MQSPVQVVDKAIHEGRQFIQNNSVLKTPGESAAEAAGRPGSVSDGGDAQAGGGSAESSTDDSLLFLPPEDDERWGVERHWSMPDITLLNKRDRDKTVILHRMLLML